MTASDSSAVPELGLISRAIGMITAPTNTFRSVVASPRPAGILFLVCLVMGLATALPQMTEKGRRSSLELQVQQTERFMGTPVTPEMYAQMERQSRFAPYFTFGGIFVFMPFLSILFAALYWFVFNVILGGQATFKQVVGVVAHSQVITALGAVLAAPIQIVQGVQSSAGPFNLGALVPMLAPESFLASFLGAVTFFTLWQVIVSGIGLAVLYRRSATSIITGLMIFSLGLTALFVFGISSFTNR